MEYLEFEVEDRISLTYALTGLIKFEQVYLKIINNNLNVHFIDEDKSIDERIKEILLLKENNHDIKNIFNDPKVFKYHKRFVTRTNSSLIFPSEIKENIKTIILFITAEVHLNNYYKERIFRDILDNFGYKNVIIEIAHIDENINDVIIDIFLSEKERWF